ncbi:hypothetical protein HMPREF3156_00251 [Neisseria sp. HMSC06F02]|nr:hypothetical protein HMPREF3156_00251 [Neisseria sp. HMSC06F02]
MPEKARYAANQGCGACFFLADIFSGGLFCKQFSDDPCPFLQTDHHQANRIHHDHSGSSRSR